MRKVSTEAPFEYNFWAMRLPRSQRDRVFIGRHVGASGDAPFLDSRLDDRPFLQRLPRRNVRRALFLVAALLAVLAIKYRGGSTVDSLFDAFAPLAPAPAPGSQANPGTLRLKVVPAGKQTADRP